MREVTIKVTEPKRIGLIKLLDPDHPLKTPFFQRSFAWTDRQVRDYWNDLRAALDSGPSDYFMGLIVVDGERRIQDGQQRLATTLLFVQELYELAKQVAKEASTFNEQISDEIAAVLAPLNRASKPVLEIGPDDQEALLRRAGITPTLPESTRRLKAARKQIRGFLEADIADRSANAKLARLLSWAQQLEQRAYVVELEVPSQVAHKIFETLNTRGLRLSNGDLVKSYLLARASNHAHAQAAWAEVVKALSDEAGNYEDDLEDFLYHYYGSAYDKPVSQEKFFASFAEKVTDEDPIDVLDRLGLNAQLYAGLIRPFQAPALAKFSDEAKYAIQFMYGMGFRQLRYLLLAVLRDYARDETAITKRRTRQSQLIVKIAAWTIRGLVTGRLGGGTPQKLYIAAAAAIRKDRNATDADIRKLFLAKQLFVTTNSAFEEGFLAWSFDPKQGRVILVELERAELGSNAAVALKGTLTLEHVLPRRPREGTWTNFQGDDRTRYPSRVGNYLLLSQPFNSNLGNIEWPDKREKLKAERESRRRL